MAQQTITLSAIATEQPQIDVHYDLDDKNIVVFLKRTFAEASYPDIHPDFVDVTFDKKATQEAINTIFARALTDALTDRKEITDVEYANVYARTNPKTDKACIFFGSARLTTADPMDEGYARDALARHLDVDAATLAIEREMTAFGHSHAQRCKAVVDIKPEVKPWHDLKTTNPDLFYEMAAAAFRHFGRKPWAGAWSEAHSEIENFQYWAMKNHPDVDAFTQLIGMNPDPAALPAAPTAAPEPTANTNNQPTSTMAKTANTNIPAGYKVAPAPENATPEQIAEQFKSQFEKALSAVSPSGAKLADCELVWSATTRPNDLPGRIITCKVIENEQTYHTFTFDCKDRHRDSTTYDEGMKFDWLSVDAMIKAFDGKASVLDCVKDGCKKRLMGPAAAPAPKAQTKSEPTAAPQTAAPAAPQPAEGAAAPTEATTPAYPKANTKTAPTASPQTPQTPQTSQTPQTPSVFQTYECSQTPAFYYHLYGEGENSGIVVIHRETGDIRQHCANQTMESSRALIKQHGMTEVQPIPTVVITALIKEGVIKAPLSINNEQLTINNDHADEKAAAEKAAAEQREREEREAAERAEQERKAAEERKRKEAEAKAKREAEERAKREAAEKAKREEEERKRKEAEEEAKRKAEEEEAKKRRGTHHPQFNRIIKITNTGEAVYGHGKSGTGKTHIAQQMAEHYGLPFSSNGCIYQPYELVGYMDANGNYHETAFIHAVRHGGMHLFDEFDRSCPQAPVACNSLLANGFIDLPNGERLYMHKDFHLFACGNTIGTGADADYTAAQPLDLATLDRFTPIEIDYDEQVELSLAKGDGALVEFVHEMRRAVDECHYKHLLSYRAIIRMVKFMECFTLEEALQLAIVRTMSRDDARNVCSNMHLPASNRYMTAFSNVVKTLKRVAA